MKILSSIILLVLVFHFQGFSQNTNFDNPDSIIARIDFGNNYVCDFIDIDSLMSQKYEKYQQINHNCYGYTGMYTEYTFKNNKSEIVISDDSTNRNMLVKAAIADNSFPLKYGVRIGMKRTELYKILTWFNPDKSDTVSYSGTGDSYLTFYFRHNKLTKLVYEFTE
jgi:hypothetical protein